MATDVSGGKSRFSSCCIIIMLLLSGVTQGAEPAEPWEGSWAVRMVIPSSAWPDLVTSWDPTLFSAQFNQLTSSEYVMVNVTHPANSRYFTSPNPPLAAALPEDHLVRFVFDKSGQGNHIWWAG